MKNCLMDGFCWRIRLSLIQKQNPESARFQVEYPETKWTWPKKQNGSKWWQKARVFSWNRTAVEGEAYEMDVVKRRVHFVSFLFKSTYNNLLHSSSFCDAPRVYLDDSWLQLEDGTEWEVLETSIKTRELPSRNQKTGLSTLPETDSSHLKIDDWKIRSPFGIQTIFRCDDRCELLVSSSVSRSYFKQQAKTSAPYPLVVSIEARAKSAALHEWVPKVKTLKGSIFQKNLRKVREYPFRNIRYIIFSCCNLK